MYIKIHVYLFVWMAYFFYQKRLSLFLLYYLSVFVHETAHIVVALLLNVSVDEIHFGPFGVSAQYNGKIKDTKELLISISGPILSLILATLAKSVLIQKINFMIFLFNMLPIYPLDGGRIQRIFWIKIMGFQKGKKFSHIITIFFLVLTLILFVICAFLFFNPYYFLLVINLISLYRKEAKKEKILSTINCLQIEE